MNNQYQILLIATLIYSWKVSSQNSQKQEDKCFCNATQFLTYDYTCISNEYNYGYDNCMQYDYDFHKNTILCVKCKDQYSLSFKQLQCKLSPVLKINPDGYIPFCKEYMYKEGREWEWECKECISQYALQQDTKQKCIQYPNSQQNIYIAFCSVYQNLNGTHEGFYCEKCQSDYYLQQDTNRTCSQAPQQRDRDHIENCVQYIYEGVGSWKCEKCAQKFKLVQDTMKKCVSPSISQIPQGCEEFLASSENSYTCTKCGQNLPVLKRGVCVKNPGSLSDSNNYTPNCKIWKFDLYKYFCIECEGGYYFDHYENICKIIPEKIENCIKYEKAYVCEICEDNYYLQEGICVLCFSKCKIKYLYPLLIYLKQIFYLENDQDNHNDQQQGGSRAPAIKTPNLNLKQTQNDGEFNSSIILRSFQIFILMLILFLI